MKVAELIERLQRMPGDSAVEVTLQHVGFLKIVDVKLTGEVPGTVWPYASITIDTDAPITIDMSSAHLTCEILVGIPQPWGFQRPGGGA